MFEHVLMVDAYVYVWLWEEDQVWGAAVAGGVMEGFK